MAQTTFTIEGDVNVQVVVTENGDGTLNFQVDVLDETGSIGDLNGLFFDISNDSLVDGLVASGDDVTETAFNANKITKVDGYNNVNGEVAGDYGKFDGGVQFGTQGIGTDDIRSTSFTLSHADQGLTLDDILSQDFAIRLTSVGEEGGTRDDSLKLGGEAPPEADPEIDPEVDPEVDPDVDPEIDPDVDPEIDPDVDPEIDPDVDPEIDPEVDPDVPPLTPDELDDLGGFPTDEGLPDDGSDDFVLLPPDPTGTDPLPEGGDDLTAPEDTLAPESPEDPDVAPLSPDELAASDPFFGDGTDGSI